MAVVQHQDKAQTLYTKAGLPVRKMHLVRGDVVIVMKPKKMQPHIFDEKLGHFAEDIANYTGVNTIVIGVMRKWDEIRKLDETQMASFGWVRRERVIAFMDDSPEEVDRRMNMYNVRQATIGGDEEE